MCCTVSVGKASQPPKWIRPQLTRLVDEAPAGKGWLHEIKYDGYRMHARLDAGRAQLLTRTGLDWSHRYRRTIDALHALPVKAAYLDGELCALRPDGVPAFSRLQAAMDEGRTDDLVFIVFDLLYLNGKSTALLPLIERKERLRSLFAADWRGLRFSDHVVGNGPRFREQACKMKLEGIISKRVDRPYAPWRSGPVGQVEVPEPRGICRRWLDQAGWKPTASWCAAAGLLHRGWTTALRWARRQRIYGRGAQTSSRRAPASGDAANASRPATTTGDALRLTA